MLFHTPATFVGLASVIISGVKALTITSPSGSHYWVQFQPNIIAWNTCLQDPQIVTLQIIQPDSKTFTGPFSIAEYVHVSGESCYVTNVTLSVADGYQIQMVDPVNMTTVFATSAPFSVWEMGTPPSEITLAPGTVNATQSNRIVTSTSGANNTKPDNGSIFRNSNGSPRFDAESSVMGYFQTISLPTSLTLVGLSFFLSYVSC